MNTELPQTEVVTESPAQLSGSQQQEVLVRSQQVPRLLPRRTALALFATLVVETACGGPVTKTVANATKTILTPTPKPTATPKPTPTAPEATPTPEPTPTPEVRQLYRLTTSGSDVIENGSRIRGIGFNRYDILNMNDNAMEAIFQAVAQAGGSMLRFWCFKSEDFPRMDQMVKYAKQYGIYLYPSLIDHWGTYGQPLDDAWYQGGYTSSYLPYVEQFVQKYIGKEAIAVVEFVNEPQTTNSADLQTFTKDIAGRVHAIDPGRLTSIGSIGTGQPGMQQGDYLTVTEGVDVASFHDDNDLQTTDPGGLLNDFKTRVAETNGIRPLIVGELGINTDPNSTGPHESVSARDTDTLNKLRAYFRSGVAFVLGWSIGSNEFGYDLTLSDPAIQQAWEVVEQELKNGQY